VVGIRDLLDKIDLEVVVLDMGWDMEQEKELDMADPVVDMGRDTELDMADPVVDMGRDTDMVDLVVVALDKDCK
jgi:hypothetical protein